MEDSPPDFITIRTPEREVVDTYELALELVAVVHVVLAKTTARFHVKDRIDRYTTQVTMRLARARTDVKPNRWRYYRDVIEHLTDIGTMLDIVDRQHESTAHAEHARAVQIVRQLVAALLVDAHLAPS